MHRADEIRLRHMLDAAREAVSFTRGRARADLETDRQLEQHKGTLLNYWNNLDSRVLNSGNSTTFPAYSLIAMTSISNPRGDQ